MNGPALALLALAQRVPDPEDVKPGWLGFLVVLLLGVAVVFLAFSFRKQLRRTEEHFTPSDHHPGDRDQHDGA